LAEIPSPELDDSRLHEDARTLSKAHELRRDKKRFKALGHHVGSLSKAYDTFAGRKKKRHGRRG
jgi:hypothetical protein